jgi:DNA-binding MarR family transcriptional regulator
MTLAVHNAVALADDEVRDRFVVRHRELEELLAHLREDDPPRHVLVIGGRGMGKSLLLRRVAVSVADDPALAARWLPVLMPEELYEVTSTGELWLAALDRLARAEGDPGLAAQHAALAAERDPSRLSTLALERLLAAARARGRKVLLLAENVDMLLDDQVGADDGWALRHALQTEPDLLLMATALGTFAQVEEPSEAFYGFFHRLDLGPLDDDDVRALWHKVTGAELAGERIVPVRILTGGIPRLVNLLGRFSTRPDLGSLWDDLELLIDEYTPYFKASIETLPPVERKVFVTLADIWAPANAAEVAEKARMTSSQVSALLGRLVRRGAVRPVEEDKGRQRYEVTERLYNLYHLVRRSGGEGRARALVDALVRLSTDADPGTVLASWTSPLPRELREAVSRRG